jgi:uncharacterized membrane protein YgdD (TMEM256/DUF423 family)
MRPLTASAALKITAILGALAVALGAFGAHGLEDLLTRTGRVETWKTAAAYHLVHSVVLLVLVHLPNWRPLPWAFLAAGITIFSGSLYLLCLTDTGWLGAITPIGGLLLIAGWGSLIFPAKGR